MATADTDRVANETIERLAQCLKLSERASFKSACKSRDIRTLDMTAQQFFSTWTTSLMGDDLQRLNELAVRPDISSHVKILCIEDDTRKYDPWNVSEPPAPGSTNLWPWDELGIVNSEDTSLTIISLILDKKNVDLSPDSWVFLPRDESVAISNPDVREMILELSLQDKGKGLDFSELRTVS